jgi:hypothetical protein
LASAGFSERTAFQLRITYGMPVPFKDPQLEAHVKDVATAITGLPDDQRTVVAFLDAYNWFAWLEGEQSPRAQEALEALLSWELRHAVRNWYRTLGETIHPNARAFRDRLSELAKERFG